MEDGLLFLHLIVVTRNLESKIYFANYIPNQIQGTKDFLTK